MFQIQLEVCVNKIMYVGHYAECSPPLSVFVLSLSLQHRPRWQSVSDRNLGPSPDFLLLQLLWGEHVYMMSAMGWGGVAKKHKESN